MTTDLFGTSRSGIPQQNSRERLAHSGGQTTETTECFIVSRGRPSSGGLPSGNFGA